MVPRFNQTSKTKVANNPKCSYSLIIHIFKGQSLEAATTSSNQKGNQRRLKFQGPVVTREVTHTGTKIHLPDTGISLTIPEGAVSKETKFEICLSLSLDDDHPELEEGHTLICPIVKCQPHGIHFLKPAKLTLPCYAVDDIEDDLIIWSKTSGKIW